MYRLFYWLHYSNKRRNNIRNHRNRKKEKRKKKKKCCGQFREVKTVYFYCFFFFSFSICWFNSHLSEVDFHLSSLSDVFHVSIQFVCVCAENRTDTSNTYTFRNHFIASETIFLRLVRFIDRYFEFKWSGDCAMPIVLMILIILNCIYWIQTNELSRSSISSKYFLLF